MRRRQVHLDFHTSEKIDGIGSAFSKQQFQEMLKKGHVDSITYFLNAITVGHIILLKSTKCIRILILTF